MERVKILLLNIILQRNIKLITELHEGVQGLRTLSNVYLDLKLWMIFFPGRFFRDILDQHRQTLVP
jgi:hypothetical protein